MHQTGTPLPAIRAAIEGKYRASFPTMTPDAVPVAAMSRMVVSFGNRSSVISSKRVRPL